MSGGRRPGTLLMFLTEKEKAEWPLGAKVWYPNGVAGWIKGEVTGYTLRYIVMHTTMGTRKSQPHRLRRRAWADDRDKPTISAY